MKNIKIFLILPLSIFVLSLFGQAGGFGSGAYYPTATDITNGVYQFKNTVNNKWYFLNDANTGWVSKDSLLFQPQSANIVATAAQTSFTFTMSGVDPTIITTSRIKVYRNGILAQVGAGNDYTLGTLTSTTIPITWVGGTIAVSDKLYTRIE